MADRDGQGFGWISESKTESRTGSGSRAGARTGSLLSRLGGTDPKVSLGLGDGQKPKLLVRLRRELRIRHRSISTERSYVGWVKRFIHFHELRHPEEMGQEEIEKFLNHLASDLGVAASTQNQALNALVFLYRWVLKREVAELTGLVRAKRPGRLPVVMTPEEVESVMSRLAGDSLTVCLLLWGGGLRLKEALRLRVQDIDFDRRELRVRRQFLRLHAC